MPLFVPVIIIGANAVGIVAGGYSAAQGTLKIRQGRRIAERAETSHASAHDRAGDLRAEVQQLLDRYGEQRADASGRVLERMVAYLRANNRLAEVTGIDPISDVPIEPEVLDPITLRVDSKQAASSLLSASHAAVASPAALAQIATNVGKASTGTAIKSLSGVASKNATLAWLGGGAKAAGGGGMALGGVMGPLTAVGTGVTVLGLGANVAGERYLSSATEKAAQLEIAEKELGLYEKHLDGIYVRIGELSTILESATVKAEESLAILEQLTPRDFEFEHHFARALHLVTSVSQIIRTRVEGEQDAADGTGDDKDPNSDQAGSLETEGE